MSTGSLAPRAAHHGDAAGEARSFAVRIRASPERVYERWNRVEEFPRFMPAVQRVKELAVGHVLWEASDPAGRPRLFESRVVERVPGRSLAWCSVSGASYAGRVEVIPLPDGTTRFELRLHYAPSGAIERLADALGLLDVAIARELRRFGRFVETQVHPRL